MENNQENTRGTQTKEQGLPYFRPFERAKKKVTRLLGRRWIWIEERQWKDPHVHVADFILKKATFKVGVRATNSFVLPWNVKDILLDDSGEELRIPDQYNYQGLKDMMNEDGLEEDAEHFEAVLFKYVSSKKDFFDPFDCYIGEKELSLVEGICVYIALVSGFTRSHVLSYVIVVLLTFYYWLKFSKGADINKAFSEDYIPNSGCPDEDIVVTYLKHFIPEDRWPFHFPKPGEVIENFVKYFYNIRQKD